MAHRVVITGGTGFLGQLTARSILRRGSLLAHAASGKEVPSKVTEVVLADIVRPPTLMFGLDHDPAVSVAIGSVADAAFTGSLTAGAASLSIFHLGAIMSGHGEQDFDLCIQTNLVGTMNLLEAARACPSWRPRFLFASTMATIGTGKEGDHIASTETITDAHRATPHTTCADAAAGSEPQLPA